MQYLQEKRESKDSTKESTYEYGAPYYEDVLCHALDGAGRTGRDVLNANAQHRGQQRQEDLRESERKKEKILEEIVERYNAVLIAEERKSKKKAHEQYDAPVR